MPKVDRVVHHDHAGWLKDYTVSKPDHKKSMRAGIAAQTKDAVKHGYSIKDKEVKLSYADTAAMMAGTKVFAQPKDLFKGARTKMPTKVHVINGDTIDVTRALQKHGLNPVALNLGNETHPGGGWKSGAAAQEESLFRRSNYYLSLTPKKNTDLKKQLPNGEYRIPEFGCIYSPGVTVFRKNESQGCEFDEPFKVDFIVNAAYDFKKGYVKDYENKMKSKIRAVLRVADGTGHDSVVLGASGCGAFGNKPEVVSKLFKEVIEDEFKKGQFKEIVFAIIDDHNSSGNFKTFEKEFGSDKPKASQSSEDLELDAALAASLVDEDESVTHSRGYLAFRDRIVDRYDPDLEAALEASLR